MCEHLGSIPTTGMVLKKETTNPLALDLIPTATRKSRQRKRREKKKATGQYLCRLYSDITLHPEVKVTECLCWSSVLFS